MTVDELKSKLIGLGYSETELKKLNKNELKDLVDSAENAHNVLDAVDNPTTEVQQVEMSPSDPKWTEYIMSQFAPNELDNGMPKVDGLRRVAELVFGSFSSETDIKQTPTIENGGRATVVVYITFDRTGNRCSGAADVYSGNTDKKFALHPVATAETRAEGRALRKALRLVTKLAAEELQNADPDEPDGNDERIISGMLNGLNVMCDRMGIDLFKIAVKMGYNITSVEDLTKRQGIEISKQLSKYQRKEEALPDVVRK